MALMLVGESLSKELRARCDALTRRLWIASPFIGSWNYVRRLIGKNCTKNPAVDIRLLTDLRNKGWIDYRTLKVFYDRGKLKSLLGLHAKLYILDDSVILTSANLTGAAFSRRHEVGVLLCKGQSEEYISLFDRWWSNLAKDVNEQSITELKNASRTTFPSRQEEGNVDGLEILFELPDDPGDISGKLASRFLDFDAFIRSYVDLSEMYQGCGRVWKDAPLFLEVDGFLNYLFHDHPDTPSAQYLRKEPRVLNVDRRKREVERYHALYMRAVRDGEDNRWREENSRIARRILAPNRIKGISRDDVARVVKLLNCMNSLPLVRAKFLNPTNNRLETIRAAWEDLLFGEEVLSLRMTRCHDVLYSFGKSSIAELLGFYYPDRYPIRNRNSSAGLRFFGYDVQVY